MTIWREPTRADLFNWLQLVDTGQAGDEYDMALAVAVEQQKRVCQVYPYSALLHAAALRRAARFLATRGMALGTFDAGDFGQQSIPWKDTEVQALESSYRVEGIA